MDRQTDCKEVISVSQLVSQFAYESDRKILLTMLGFFFDFGEQDLESISIINNGLFSW